MLLTKPFNRFYNIMKVTKLFNSCKGSFYRSFLKIKLIGLMYVQKPSNLLLVPVLHQISFLSKVKEPKDILTKNLQIADQHYDDMKYEEVDVLLTTLLTNDYPKNDEVLWRLARIKYELSKRTTNENKDKLVEEAFKFANRALEINPNNGYAHKWLAVIIDSVAPSRSIRERVNMALQTRDHLEEALKHIPQDGTTHYILGLWYFSIADFTWYERKISSALNSSFPTPTYQDALKCFQRAEEVEPNFYSRNYLFLGKCFLRLKDNDKAVDFLVKARDYPQKTAEDKDTHAEANELLRKLGAK